MKNIRVVLSENIHFLVVKFSIYLNRHVFEMRREQILSFFERTFFQKGLDAQMD